MLQSIFFASKKLRSLFQKDDYPMACADNAIKRFNDEKSQNEKYEKDFLVTIGIPYYGRLFI